MHKRALHVLPAQWTNNLEEEERTGGQREGDSDMMLWTLNYAHGFAAPLVTVADLERR